MIARIDKGRWMLCASVGGVASTIKTSNHRELNIVAPKGGRGEMGVLVIYETKKGKDTSISARRE